MSFPERDTMNVPEKTPRTKYGDESLEDVLQEIAWGLDLRYDSCCFSGTEMMAFIKRIKAVVDLTMVRKPNL